MSNVGALGGAGSIRFEEDVHSGGAPAPPSAVLRPVSAHAPHAAVVPVRSPPLIPPSLNNQRCGGISASIFWLALTALLVEDGLGCHACLA